MLIIGGTIEGRVAVRVCDEAAKPYFYSTRTASQQVECAYGVRVSGDLDGHSMLDFCTEQGIQLIVDAAHPFAQNVHRNVGATAHALGIPVIRFDRQFPSHDPRLHWFDDYSDAIQFLEEQGIERLLALTGVNSIPKLKPYWEKHSCTFRIMNRRESLDAVSSSGLSLDRILFYDDESNDASLFQRIKPDAIITKESGESGGFSQKVATALSLGIPVLVIRCPQLPYAPSATVYGRHGLRKQTEMLLPLFFDLKTGYTSGSCATAASKAALIALLCGKAQSEVSILLPSDEPVSIPISQTVFEPDGSVTCTVVKDSGDDPDVTNGLDICANVSLDCTHDAIRFLQGKGVGRVTLPGLGLEIGSPAVNLTPRKMMEREACEVRERFSDDLPIGVNITISVPRGEEVALKTFNPKLGIVGGISIIGTSGVVKPFSSEAFVNAIRREAQVAKAMGVTHIVINSGAKSERFLKALYPNLLPQAFIQYGNFIGETLRIASEEGFGLVTMGVMIGKAVKLAEGELDTHSKKTVMNRPFLQSLAQEAGCSAETISHIGSITLARELWGAIPPQESNFFQVLLQRCYNVCQPLLPQGQLTLLLIDEEGQVVLLR
ncbi:MAG: cobalamin biosynthesis protein CbiD [Bacteroidales bacterium]|nr:cobalamin biosynthesis protein CbiD [Bacteroidales bacterium]MBN2750983.1 cobalamin biosynthesis protein CbiD [Bacteroidales bacterium]